MDRRRFIASSIAAGTAALSGCTAIGGQSDGDAPPPSFGPVGDRWEQFDETSGVALERNIGPITVTATQQTVLLDNAELRTDLREKTLDGIDAQLSIAFATRVDLDPPIDQIPGGLGRVELMDRIEQAGVAGFEDQLAASGIEDVEPVGETTIETESGVETTATEYEATYAFDDVSFPVMDDRTITLSGGDLSVTGWLAAWHDGSGPLIAGAVYPGENFVRTVEESLTEGILVRLDVDLGFEPAAYREEVFDLIGSVK